jgi:hypothetical protein
VKDISAVRMPGTPANRLYTGTFRISGEGEGYFLIFKKGVGKDSVVSEKSSIFAAEI